jgi:hypothetical protein
LVVPVSCDEEPNFISSVSLEDGTDEHGGVSRLEMQEFLRTLPRNLHWDKERSKQSQQQRRDDKLSQQDHDKTLLSNELNVLPEELEDEEGDQDKVEEAEAGLEIAWQYRTSVQQERLAQTTTSSSSTAKSRNVYCHSFDLSGQMLEQHESFPVASETSGMDPFLESFHIVTVQELSGHGRRHSAATCGMAFFRQLVHLLQDKIKDNKLVRLLLYHPPALDMLTLALPLLLAHIRHLQWPVVILVCLAPPIGATREQTYFQTLLYRMVDVVLITEGFSSRREYPPPPEFRHLQGLLTIRKVSTVTAATANGGGHFGDLTMTKRPAAYVYGLKRDRRKLHIPLLHIPPEDYAAGGGSVGSGGVRSGAGLVDTKPSKASHGGGMGCSSNLSGSVLDF